MQSLDHKKVMPQGAVQTQERCCTPETGPVRILKKELEEVFGCKVLTSGDCIQLSEEIYFKTGERINFNTLRRFFGLVKAPHPPSRSTLNILGAYCGFNSFDELMEVRQSSLENELPNEKATLISFLVTLFKVLPVKGGTEEVLLPLIKHTTGFIYSSKELADRFHKSIIKTKAGQELFFEQFINIDHINGAYASGLRLYLKEKKTPDAQVFAYSLLCFRDWLNDDLTGLKKQFEVIKKVGLPQNAPLLIKGHYLSAHLLYANAFGLNPAKIVDEANGLLLDLKPEGEDPKKQLSFVCNLVLSLVLTGHYQEALFFTNSAFNQWSEHLNQLDKGWQQKLLLIKAIALYKTSEVKAAEKILLQLRPSQFYFFSKKMDTILFLWLSACFKKNSAKLDEQMQWLIEETGFIKLKELR